MVFFESLAKAALSALIAIARLAMSFRAHGVGFDPIVTSNHDGTYTVEACLIPGRDEVLFDTFGARGCDIALGSKSFGIRSAFRPDKIGISVLVGPAHSDPGDRSVFFTIRPQPSAKKVTLVIKGGFLSQLNAVRHLPDRCMAERNRFL